jgi:hypothetical protein
MVVVIKRGSTKKEIELLISKHKKRKYFNSKKHSGVIDLKENPLDIQKSMRDDWS